MNFDYLINDNNTLSLSSNMQFLPYFKYIIKNNTLITNASQTGFNSTNLSRDEKQNLGFDLDYVHNFKEEKTKLSFNSHYTTYDYQREQDVNSNNFFTDDFLDYRTAFNTIANQETEIFTSQTDYSLSIDDSSSFEIGAKFSNIETKTDITQYDIINNEGVLNPDNTDAFDYDEMVLAGYLSFEKRWKKWSINAGLRLEQTKVEGKSVLTNQINKQDYLDWFPTGSISYQATEKISIYANYKRNIQRPSYVDLNPFKFFFNDNAYVAGNPELQPVYTDRFQIGTAISKNYIIEVFYKINNGSIFELPIQDNDNNIIAYTPLNIKESNELGLEFFAFFNPSDFWFVSFVNSLYYTKNEAVFNSYSVKLDKWSNY